MSVANAILFDLLTICKASIEARGLVGISSGNILIQKRPTNRAADLPATKYPAIVLAPFGPEGLNPMAGMNSRDDVVYKILLGILDKDSQDQAAHFNQYLVWRQSLRHLFHDQPLPNGVTAVVNGVSFGPGALSHQVQVTPLGVVDYQAWDVRGLFASGMILNAISREVRG